MRVEGWAPEKITTEIEKRAMDRLETAAGYVAALARSTFPLKEPAPMPGRKSKEPWRSMSTGKLRDTIRVVRLKGDPKQNVRVYAGNRNKQGAFYAHMIEFGTVKMSARPFLRPAFNAVKGRVKSIVENG